MKRTFFLAAMACVACLAILSCSRSSSHVITLAGSTAFQPFAEKLAEHYMQAHNDVRINVQGGGSAVGIQSAISGSADIGMADLIELPQEAKELHSTTVARDGIAIIVSPQNSVQNLSAEAASDIFTGKITNWKDLGGMDAVIRVVSREEGSGTRRSFDKMVLKDGKLAASSLFQNSNGTIREAVASDPNAIGYLSIGLVDRRVKAVAFNGAAPTNQNVKANKYPLARPVYFLTKGEIKPNVRAFIDYVLSDEAQDTLEKEGLIAVK